MEGQEGQGQRCSRCSSVLAAILSGFRLVGAEYLVEAAHLDFLAETLGHCGRPFSGAGPSLCEDPPSVTVQYCRRWSRNDPKQVPRKISQYGRAAQCGIGDRGSIAVVGIWVVEPEAGLTVTVTDREPDSVASSIHGQVGGDTTLAPVTCTR
jgi:hypothetical protein